MSKDIKLAVDIQSQTRHVGTAYILVLLTGLLGGHRFYLGQKGTAIAQLILTMSFFGMVVSSIWVVVDLFLIPDLVDDYNYDLVERLSPKK